MRFSSAKSPTLTGTVMRVGKHDLVDWDEYGSSAEAWLNFDGSDNSAAATLHMAKVDPDGDFSWDWDDLAFTRLHGCE